MLIYIEGPEAFLAQQAISQIKQKYLAKNEDGAELIEIDPREKLPNWADLHSVPLFATSRLVILKRAEELDSENQQSLAHYLENLPSSSVLVIWAQKKVSDKALQQILAAAKKVISAVSLSDSALKKYINKRTQELNFELDSNLKNDLAIEYADNMWGLETELVRLATTQEKTITKRNGRAVEPFELMNAVSRNNWPKAKDLLVQEFNNGKPVELLIGSIASSLRRSKSDTPQKKAATDLLMDIDVGLKTGSLDPSAAVALLKAHLPQPQPKRVVWEEVWEENEL